MEAMEASQSEVFISPASQQVSAQYSGRYSTSSSARPTMSRGSMLASTTGRDSLHSAGGSESFRRFRVPKPSDAKASNGLFNLHGLSSVGDLSGLSLFQEDDLTGLKSIRAIASASGSRSRGSNPNPAARGGGGGNNTERGGAWMERQGHPGQQPRGSSSGGF
eukprot:CAMPEP_0197607648 /NCGR_PEP_ID=MMETSP1326-20131121/47504_1 /TAXON_ID=1155430 /ORGANISM="Genus nov. species nov., Strain RCC2288" /LENGTH=162 /DNA_ID=CAMNT_0043175725 /DNA_START=160 /DNA_END=645 /DNA_ORIENTATION=-